MAVLVLNATYEPLTVVSWKRAITMMFAGRAEMVEQDGDRVIRSAGGAVFPRPQVVRLVHMVSFASMRKRRPAVFSKSGLIARDGGVCQVAGCEAHGDSDAAGRARQLRSRRSTRRPRCSPDKSLA